jgi:adenosylcobinamide-GDP ribazoletransferase
VTGFLVALEFLTTLRLRRVSHTTTETMARTLPWFSLVGLLLGLLLAGLELLLRPVLSEPALSAILVTSLVLLTGGLHLDGLADTSDGIFGGATLQRRLEIMRDSHIGSFGVIGITMVLLLKWSALLSIHGDLRIAALITVPTLSRMALSAAILTFPYARPEGLGGEFHARARASSVVINAIAPAAALLLLMGPKGIVLMAPAFGFVLAGGRYVRNKIDGLTGDSYGALIETAEVLLLLLIATGANLGWLG